MKEEDLQALTDSISSKLGEENAALIADDLGKLITQNHTVLDELSTKDEEIANLKKKNEQLVSANSSLLQQVPMGIDNTPKVEEREKSNEPFNYKSLMDKDGRLKRTLE